MAATPRKTVQWDTDYMPLPSLNSPFIETDSVASVVSTSSLEHINSQLVAHGFISPPGLILDGISNSALDRVVKCLLGMLSQRMEDMSRTEQLTTKLRTLSYDHERLLAMYRTATETAANAEREEHVHKSRLLVTTRTLQATEAAHKQTIAELQRTRTTMQGIRTTHQNEIKKKEKDVERMSEKWSKLADAQAKLATVPSGIRCANISIITGSELVGKGQGFLDVALEEAEKARGQLLYENGNLKKLILSSINEVRSILHQAQHLSSHHHEEAPFTLTTLFPLHPPGMASDKWNIVVANLQECLNSLSQRPCDVPRSSNVATPVSNQEIERLQGIIDTLRGELEQSRKQNIAQAETQTFFDQFLDNHNKIVTRDIGDTSMELMSAPLRDAEKERLDNMKEGLEQERRKFTDAAVRLGKERAEMEAERLKLLDERRSWQVEMMLAELPPTPQPQTSPRRTTAIYLSPKKSPRKSPAKVFVRKTGEGSRRKTMRVSRSLASPTKVLPSYETEVLPPIPAPMFNTKPLPIATSLLPTSFILPPPTPQTSLPTKPALPFPIPPPDQPPLAIMDPSPSGDGDPNLPALSTPFLAHRLFPVAKPLAQRMIHAYSPAKPSPLSRILMLGNSPKSPASIEFEARGMSGLLQPVFEGDDALDFGESLALSQVPLPLPQPQVSPAVGLGAPESSPEDLSREKKVEADPPSYPIGSLARATKARGRVFHPDPNRHKEKGRKKAEPTSTLTTSKTSAAIEKENNKVKPVGQMLSDPKKVSPAGTVVEAKKQVKPLSKPGGGISASRTRQAAKVPPPGPGGPRRVLIDSAEAPPMGKGIRR